MIKAVSLDDGREVEFHFELFCRQGLSAIVLRHGRTVLGRVYRDEGGAWAPSDIRYWHGLPGEREAALAWHLDRHPDLAGADEETILRAGIMREVAALAPIIERAREMEAAIAQRETGLYVAVDEDGRVRAIGDSAPDVVWRAECDGWEGWYSLARASEDTLWITPADNVRVEL